MPAAGIQKALEFLNFIRILAGRVAEVLDYNSFSRDIGVDIKTIKEWLSVLEWMHVVALVQPDASNLSSRLIKSPKVFFIDTGLACRLQGWTSAAPILTSPQQGHLFENLVFSEIFKFNPNYQAGLGIFHWRSRAGGEVDFLIQKAPGDFLFVESKFTAVRLIDPESLPKVRKVFKNKVPPIIQCHQEGSRILARDIPIAQMATFLGNWV